MVPLSGELLVRDFLEKHAGDRCWIMGNGPSLLDAKPYLKKLRGKIIGTNRSYEFYPEPDYYVALDPPYYEGKHESFTRAMDDQGKLFCLKGRPYGIPIEERGVKPTRKNTIYHVVGWSWDMTYGAYMWQNVGYFALQLAVYMGFRKIYLLGMDSRKLQDQTHFYGNRDRPVTYPKFPNQKEAFGFAAGVLSEYNANAERPIKVWNCSVYSALQAFPKIPLGEAVKYENE